MSFIPGTLATLDQYSPEGESWEPPALGPTPQQLAQQRAIDAQARAGLQSMIPKAPLAWGSPRVAQAPSDTQVMGGLLEQLPVQQPPQAFRDRVYGAISGAGDVLNQFIPPELRGKAGSVGTLANAINPAASSARTMENLREGKYLGAAAEFAGMLPGEQLLALGKVGATAGKAMMGALADPTVYGPAAAIFIGPKAATANTAALAQARKMERAGASSDSILDTTGWSRSPVDKKWRYEISDRDTAINTEQLAKATPMMQTPEGTWVPNVNTKTAADVFPHPELYAAYPGLGNAQVLTFPGVNSFGERSSYRGGYSPAKNTVFLNRDLSPEEARTVALHELQHGVQMREGFVGGGDPESKMIRERVSRAYQAELEAMQRRYDAINQQMWDWTATQPGGERYPTPELIKRWQAANPRLVNEQDALFTRLREMVDTPSLGQRAFEEYRRVGGEVEARNVQARADFTPEQRFLVRPYVTEDVPRELQWKPRAPRGARMGDTVEELPPDIMAAKGPSGTTRINKAPAAPTSEAEFERMPVIGGRLYNVQPGPVNAGIDAPVKRRIQTVTDPQRMMYPGIYKDPRVIAREAAENTAPEHPALKQLFGVTRDDLWEIGGRGTRPGNMEPQIWQPSRSNTTSYVADALSNRRNAQRMIDAMVEAQRYPQLTRGMDAWYVMDPAFDQMVRLVGREQAIKDYQQFNGMMTPFSSNSTVDLEINRGTAARMMANRGEFDQFANYLSGTAANRPEDFPPILRDVEHHLRHRQHLPPVQRFMETGAHGYEKDTVKNPLYTQASGVPATGFQTRLGVPDAHFARGAGAADVRKTTTPQEHMSGAEYRQFGPWYRENVAEPIGIQAVPAQGRMWGVFAPQTGVKTAVGAPKLELLAQRIWDRARQLGIDPKVLRDQVLRGENHAMWLLAPGLGAATMGGIAAQDQYQ